MTVARSETSLAQTLRHILKIEASKARFIALFIGQPGSGKSVISKHLAFDYLQGGQNVLYVTTERSPTQIVERMKPFGWNVESYVGKQLKFADLYSWQIDGENAFKETPYGFRVCPLNQTELQLTTRHIIEHIGTNIGRVVFDSLTTLTSLIGEQQATRFVQVLNARIRETAAGCATLTAGVHSENFQTHMHSAYDLIFELKIEAKEMVQRYMRVVKFAEGPHPPDWIRFSITDRGIVLDSILTSL